MHRGVIKSCEAWWAHTIFILVKLIALPLSGTLLDCPQLHQKIFGNASQYMDFVQCQSWNWHMWHPCFYIQGYEKGILLHQRCGVQILVLLVNGFSHSFLAPLISLSLVTSKPCKNTSQANPSSLECSFDV